MASEKQDRRVVKTKRAIRRAFSELLSEKPFNEINIKEISDRADIDRKTFYYHYQGIHEVVDEIEDEIVSAFEEDLSDFDFGQSIRHPDMFFGKISRIIDSDMDFYEHLLRSGNTTLIPKTVAVLKKKMTNYLRTQPFLRADAVDTVSNYIVSGITAAYQAWFTSDRQLPIEHLTRQVSALVRGSIAGIMQAGLEE